MIANELRALSGQAFLKLYTLDPTPIDPMANKIYFHPYYDRGVPLTFRGIPYRPLPVFFSGFETTLAASPNRPTIRIGNVAGALSDLVAQYNDLINARLVQTITCEQFLDDKPTADPLRELPSAIYRFERKVTDIPGVAIEFELSCFDFDGVQLPRGVVKPNNCGWIYRSVEDCAYAGQPVDRNNRVSGDVGYLGDAADTCTKTVAACRARHGRLKNPLRFEGFPGTLRMPREG